MVNRRHFVLGAVALAAFRDDSLATVLKLTRSPPDPADEAFWRALRDSFQIDPTLTVFNHVGLAPPPKVVSEAMAREERRAAADPSYIIWRKQDHELDTIRSELAALVGCETDELALTPNATYELHTAIMGIRARERDEFLAGSHEYPRTETAMTQRSRRDGIVRVEVPVAPASSDASQIVKNVLERVTGRTKLVCLSHITYLTGQILPIKPIADALAERNIPLLFDGAQSIGLLPDTLRDLNAPIYTACLHKWMMGPIGTGIFVVRRPWIQSIWPLHPADSELDEKITKFEQIGTRPAAPFLALRETLEFHRALGTHAKAQRLLLLRQRLAEHFLHLPGVTHFGSLDPPLCQGMLTVGFTKAPARDLAAWLLSKHSIHVTTAVRAGVDGIRISPNVFTTPEEIDRLGRALRLVAREGL